MAATIHLRKSLTDEAIVSAINKAASSLGYSSVREKQMEALQQFVRGHDVFVSLPTGSGKSLCYAMLPQLYSHLSDADTNFMAIVVSPLQALMKNQVSIYTRKGLNAVMATDECAIEL